jgi:hypothetical protein
MPWVKDLSRVYLKKLSNSMPRRIQKAHLIHRLMDICSV